MARWVSSVVVSPSLASQSQARCFASLTPSGHPIGWLAISTVHCITVPLRSGSSRSAPLRLRPVAAGARVSQAASSALVDSVVPPSPLRGCLAVYLRCVPVPLALRHRARLGCRRESIACLAIERRNRRQESVTSAPGVWPGARLHGISLPATRA
jgi:hypothetical protein